ncbi:Hypothetical_protein [Hexamita inflata]|uniref:Hypothetical_protein n=1 Tax=Hexamita inflata TaxID=28002 RepID=A0AA86URA9_9EUKA|nr:Hypothetical protein HINF_LOCUS49352 [Hexamita inflata]
MVETLTVLDVSIASNTSLTLERLDNNVSTLLQMINYNYNLSENNLQRNTTRIYSDIETTKTQLSAKIDDLNISLISSNNTLTQTTKQLRTDINLINNSLNNHLATYHIEVGVINNTLINHGSQITQLQNLLNSTKNNLQSQITTLTTAENTFYNNVNTLNSQQNSQIQELYSTIIQINTTRSNIVLDLNQLNTKINSRMYTLSIILQQKIDVARSFTQDQINWMINQLQSQISSSISSLNYIQSQLLSSVSRVIITSSTCSICQCVDCLAIDMAQCREQHCKIITKVTSCRDSGCSSSSI